MKITAFANSENNFIALLILLIIFIDKQFDIKKLSYDKKIFFTLLSSTLFIIILDILRTTIDGKTGYLFREANIMITTLYFILSFIPFVMWSIYVDFYIHKSVRKSKKRLPVLVIPAIINIILVSFSLYNKEIFFISENNIYHRGDLFLVNTALYYTYFIGTYIQMIKNRKNIRKSDFYTLLFFGLTPAILGILPANNLSKSILWLGVTISILLIYLSIQNSKINEDYLTGLYNRRLFDIYLNNSISKLDKNECLFMIVIDLNHFKKINDTYGHIEGDKALKYASNLFVSTFQTDDFISRYAGDEFIIIIKFDSDCTNCDTEIINRLERNFAEFNASDITPYNINLSFGYDIYDPELNMSAEEFITHIDQLMYEHKKINRFSNNVD